MRRNEILVGWHYEENDVIEIGVDLWEWNKTLIAIWDTWDQELITSTKFWKSRQRQFGSSFGHRQLAEKEKPRVEKLWIAEKWIEKHKWNNMSTTEPERRAGSLS